MATVKFTFEDKNISPKTVENIEEGLTILEAAELLIYPLYPNDGNDSERVYVKQLIQKYVGKGNKKQLFDTDTFSI